MLKFVPSLHLRRFFTSPEDDRGSSDGRSLHGKDVLWIGGDVQRLCQGSFVALPPAVNQHHFRISPALRDPAAFRPISQLHEVSLWLESVVEPLEPRDVRDDVRSRACVDHQARLPDMGSLLDLWVAVTHPERELVAAVRLRRSPHVVPPLRSPSAVCKTM